MVLNNLTNYGRRHSKLFTNCHVSWDTLYNRTSSRALFIYIVVQDNFNYKRCTYVHFSKLQLEPCTYTLYVAVHHKFNWSPVHIHYSTLQLKLEPCIYTYIIYIHCSAVRGVLKGGGLWGLSPPWASEIYGFQRVFRPQRVLRLPLERKKIKPPWTNSLIRP